MPRRPCTFRQQDVTRALRAFAAAGTEVRRVEIDKEGKIVVVIGTPLPNCKPAEEGPNDWSDAKTASKMTRRDSRWPGYSQGHIGTNNDRNIGRCPRALRRPQAAPIPMNAVRGLGERPIIRLLLRDILERAQYLGVFVYWRVSVVISPA
jgi:hypothetical protein